MKGDGQELVARLAGHRVGHICRRTKPLGMAWRNFYVLIASVYPPRFCSYITTVFVVI